MWFPNLVTPGLTYGIHMCLTAFGQLSAHPALDTMHPTSDSVTARLATITTDTGALARGHRDFSHFHTPELCKAAVVVTVRLARGQLAGRVDSLHQATHDTLGASTIAAVARACSARLPLNSTTRLSDLAILLDLALHAQDLPQAQAVIARAEAVTPAMAGDMRLLAIATSLDSITPANVDAATQFLTQLDALRPSVVVDRLLARHLFVNFWERQDDTLRLRQAAGQLLALADSMAPAAAGVRGYSIVDSTYQQLMRLTWWSAPDSVSALARRACRDINRMRNTWSHDCAHPTATENAQVVDMLLPSKLRVDSMQRRPAPPLHADFWFPAVQGDTIVPRRGSVTLVVQERFAYDRNIADPEHAWWEWSERHQTEHLQRWLAAFGPYGLRVTVVAATHGYALLSGLIPPAAEAQMIRAFVQDTEHLPVTVAVRITPSKFLPPPDGRLAKESDDTLYGDNSLYFQRGGNIATPYVLLKRDGTRLLETDDPDLIETALREMFTAQSATAPSSPSPVEQLHD